MTEATFLGRGTIRVWELEEGEMRKPRTENREQRTESREPRAENRKQIPFSVLGFQFSVLGFRLSVFGCLFSVFSSFFCAPLLAQEFPAPTSQCQMPRATPRLECREEGGAFLCVNTPPGSVKENFVIIKGRLNRTDTTLGSFSVSSQHEYTREIQNIVLSEPLQYNCWDQNLNGQNNFCLETNGLFAVAVPLSQLGPYTISLAVSRAEGPSMQTAVRTSLVTVPTFTEENITTDSSRTDHLKVTLDLLKGCETRELCDFIGSSTGGVTVSIDNRIENGTTRAVDCTTNVVQGGAGQFVIGVPLQAGKNQLTITVCNAATGFDKTRCPKITPPSISIGGEAAAIEILQPTSEGPFYFESTADGELPLRFRIAGKNFPTCDDSVHLSLNLGSPQKVCANSAGVFEVRLSPDNGYNVALIDVNLPNQKLVRTVAFGWGRFLSVSEEPRLKNAVQLSLKGAVLNDRVVPAVEDYLRTMDYGLWTMDEEGRTTDRTAGDGSEEILKEFAYCPKGGATQDLKMKLLKEPKIGKIDLEKIDFTNQKMQTTLKAKDVFLSLAIYKDADGDGKPDIDPLPLKIAFKKLEASPSVEVKETEKGLTVALGSPATDCDYKRGGACFHMPALFSPRKFEGAANDVGAFVTCDSSQAVSGEMESICHALNVVDRQTGGVIQEKILDVLNRAYACGAAAKVTAILRNGFAFHQKGELFELTGKVGADKILINEQGVGLSFFTEFGLPATLENNRAILISDIGRPLAVTGGADLSVNIVMPLISQIFWGLTSAGGGDFAVKIDEAFLEGDDFHFDRDCGQAVVAANGEAPVQDPRCNIRPRAKEILGNPVSDYGYLFPTDPLTLTLKPSKIFPLHAEVLGDNRLRLELADWELAVASREQKLITAKLSLRTVVEVSAPQPIADDPTRFQILLKVVPVESRVWLTPIEATNTTVIPGEVLLSNLKELLQWAIDKFGQEGSEIKIKISRKPAFLADPLLRKLGLGDIAFTPEGFDLKWDPTFDSLSANQRL